MKRILSLALCLLLALPFAAVSASAADFLNLSNAAADRSDIGWTWDSQTKTLLAYNCSVSSLELPAGSTLELAGLCKVSGYVYCYGDLTITGSGTLWCSNLNTCDGDGSLTIDGGFIYSQTLTSGDLTMKAGMVEINANKEFAAVTVYGKYLQTGGMFMVSTVKDANAMSINGMGAVIEGGCLKVSSNASAGTEKGSLWCSGNEIVNKGGVIIALNNRDGYAINNRMDSLSLMGGVTYAESGNGGNAVGGRIYASNNEKYWTWHHPEGGGQWVPGGANLTGRILVFAKTIAPKMSAGSVCELDGVYLTGSKYEETGFETSAAKLVVKDGSLVYGHGADGLVLNGAEAISGEGTLSVWSDEAGIIWENSKPRADITVKNLTIDAKNDQAFSYYNATNAGAAVFNGCNASIHCANAAAKGACQALGGFYAIDSVLSVADMSVYTGGALFGLTMDAEGSNVSIYSNRNHALKAVKTANTTPSVSIKNGSMALINDNGGYAGVNYLDTDGKTPVTGKLFLSGSPKLAIIGAREADVDIQKAMGISVYSQARFDLKEQNVSDLSEVSYQSLFVFPDGTLDIALPIRKTETLYEVGCQIHGPEAGKKVSFETMAMGEHYDAQITKWSVNRNGKWTELSAQDVFESGAAYHVAVHFTPHEGYRFNDGNAHFSINYSEGYYNSYNSVTGEYDVFFEYDAWMVLEPEKPEDPQPEPEKPAELTTPFVDVPKDAYYYDATVWAYNAKPQITDGNGKDKFMPEQICTRGQVVTFLWRAAGEPEPKSKNNPFTDVRSSDYFYKPVLWAVEQGITDGTSPDKFSPNNPCKNSHILTFIWRALGKPDDTGNVVWYQDAYNWAVKNHLLDGTYTGTYDINGQCPRKNVVQYLYVYYTMAAK